MALKAQLIRERRDLQPYARHLADLLGLKDWEIEVLDEPPPSDDAYAHVHCVFGRKRALIRLSDNFLRGSNTDQRHAIVHELLHCHFTHPDQVAGKAMTEEEYGVYHLAHEYGIDGVAIAIAQFLPLPSSILDKFPIKTTGKRKAPATSA